MDLQPDTRVVFTNPLNGSEAVGTIVRIGATQLSPEGEPLGTIYVVQLDSGGLVNAQAEWLKPLTPEEPTDG